MDYESIKASVQQQFNQVAHHYLHDSPMAETGLLDLIVVGRAWHRTYVARMWPVAPGCSSVALPENFTTPTALT